MLYYNFFTMRNLPIPFKIILNIIIFIFYYFAFAFAWWFIGGIFSLIFWIPLPEEWSVVYKYVVIVTTLILIFLSILFPRYMYITSNPKWVKDEKKDENTKKEDEATSDNSLSSSDL